jgi:hypothetical protein
MTPADPRVSICRHCQHYQPEGRRGGQCQQLSGSVQAAWKACSLAVPVFGRLFATEPVTTLPAVTIAAKQAERLEVTFALEEGFQDVAGGALMETPSSLKIS